MPRVICTLPNASTCINGVDFMPQEDGSMLSAELSTEQADAFAAIPGYALVESKASSKPAAAPSAPAAKTSKSTAAKRTKASQDAAAAAAADAETPDAGEQDSEGQDSETDASEPDADGGDDGKSNGDDGSVF